MSGVNKVIIIGNLGRDPEMSQTATGKNVCRLNVATTRKWKNHESGEDVSETEWHRVTVWGPQAKSCSDYLAKGRQVYVEGRLRTTSYDKEGQKHWSTEIVADNVQFLSAGKQGDSNTNRSEESSPEHAQPHGEVNDDDIPF